MSSSDVLNAFVSPVYNCTDLKIVLAGSPSKKSYTYGIFAPSSKIPSQVKPLCRDRKLNLNEQKALIADLFPKTKGCASFSVQAGITTVTEELLYQQKRPQLL